MNLTSITITELSQICNDFVQAVGIIKSNSDVIQTGNRVNVLNQPSVVLFN